MLAESPEGPQRGRLPGVIFRIVIVASFLVLAGQLWRLQIVEGSTYRQKSDNNRIRKADIAPSRGIMYDRNGVIVAANAPIFVVSIVPADLPDKQEQTVFGGLAGLVGVDAAQIKDKVDAAISAGDLFTPVEVKRNADRVVVMRIEERHLELPGVVVSVDSHRNYPQGALMGHLLGFTGYLSPGLFSQSEYDRLIQQGYSDRDQVGASGLEAQYEDELRGKPGRRIYEVEAGGREVGELQREDPQPGHNLVLTIDTELQKQTAEVLQAGLEPDSSGVAMLTDPRNGEVLSLVSLPSYDDNIFESDEHDAEKVALLQDERQPLFPRATAGLYPPASTFKLITASGALQEGVATRDTVIESKGAIYVADDSNPNYKRRFPDWAVLGKLNLIMGIANSSNVYFFYLGGGYEPEGFVGLGNERLAHYARMFGYGAKTGIDLPVEEDGVIPDADWKKEALGQPWFKGDTYNMAIGQGYVQATPVQVANVTNTIANGGTVYRPRLVKAITDSDGHVVKELGPSVIRQVAVSPENLQTVRDGMRASFTQGVLLPGKDIPGVPLAAKTGTGEYEGPRDEHGNLPTHGWFTAFAPFDNPQVVVTVFVEKGGGSSTAAPIGLKLLRRYFHVPDDATTDDAATNVPAPALEPGGAPRQ